jgi:hypothetical protein
MGIAIGAVLVGIFLYDLYDLYKNKNRGKAALLWLLIVLLVPLGSIVYLTYGRRDIRNNPVVTKNPAVAVPSSPAVPQKATAAVSLIGTIVGAIAVIAGVLAVGFFIFVTVVMIQCSRDPKCM